MIGVTPAQEQRLDRLIERRNALQALGLLTMSEDFAALPHLQALADDPAVTVDGLLDALEKHITDALARRN